MPYQSLAPWAVGMSADRPKAPGAAGPAAPTASPGITRRPCVQSLLRELQGSADMSSCLLVPSEGGGWPAQPPGLIPATGAMPWEEWNQLLELSWSFDLVKVGAYVFVE